MNLEGFQQGQEQGGNSAEPQKIKVDEAKLFGDLDDPLASASRKNNEGDNKSNDSGNSGDSNNGTGDEGGTNKKSENEGGKDGGSNTGAGDTGDAGDGKKGGEEGGGNTGNGSPILDSYTNYMKSFDPEFELPESISKKENLTEEEIISTFTDEIFKKKIEDPILKNYLLRKQSSDFSQEEYENEFKTEKELMSIKDPDEFLKKVYKIKAEKENKDWSDEDIEKHLSSQDKITKEQAMENTKKSIDSAIKRSYEKDNEVLIQQRKKEFENEENKNKEVINEFTKKLESKEIKPIIELDDEELKDFVKDAPNLVARDPETGTNIIEDLMSQKDFFLDMLPLLYKHYKGGLKGFDTKLKEKVKDQIIQKKLRPTPSESSRSGSRSGVIKVDDSKLYGD